MTDPRNFPDYLDALSNLGIEPSLSGIQALCKELGDPQLEFNSIQVTGTNGKTSTVRMLDSLLIAHGVRCGRYTSPHLETYRERITLGGELIEPAEFEAVGALLREKKTAAEGNLDGRLITQFETVTAAALKAFARAGVESAVLEVGMGGRWDATSVVSADVAVVTNVTLDHAEWLGPGLTDIAAEKSYVLREGNTGVIGKMRDDVAAVFRTRAQSTGSGLLEAGRDFEARKTGDSIEFRTPLSVYPGIGLGMLGDWQAENALTAVTAAEAFIGEPLDQDKVRRVLRDIRSPGRAELFESRPAVLLDGAHNLAGACALAGLISSEFADRPRVFIISAMRDKTVTKMLDALAKNQGDFIFVGVDDPRGMSTPELMECAAGLDARREESSSLEEALRKAVARVGPEGLIVVTGSLHLVGPARSLLTDEKFVFRERFGMI